MKKASEGLQQWITTCKHDFTKMADMFERVLLERSALEEENAFLKQQLLQINEERDQLLKRICQSTDQLPPVEKEHMPSLKRENGIQNSESNIDYTDSAHVVGDISVRLNESADQIDPAEPATHIPSLERENGMQNSESNNVSAYENIDITECSTDGSSLQSKINVKMEYCDEPIDRLLISRTEASTSRGILHGRETAVNAVCLMEEADDQVVSKRVGKLKNYEHALALLRAPVAPDLQKLLDKLGSAKMLAAGYPPPWWRTRPSPKFRQPLTAVFERGLSSCAASRIYNVNRNTCTSYCQRIKHLLINEGFTDWKGYRYVPLFPNRQAQGPGFSFQPNKSFVRKAITNARAKLLSKSSARRRSVLKNKRKRRSAPSGSCADVKPKSVLDVSASLAREMRLRRRTALGLDAEETSAKASLISVQSESKPSGEDGDHSSSNEDYRDYSTARLI